MKMKQLFAFLLLLSLVAVLFTGCADTEEPAPSDGGSAVTDSGTPVTPDNDDEEMAEITIWQTLNTNATEDALALVDAAINEITESKINVHVNIERVPFADYSTQVNLAIANQEPVDLISFLPSATGSFLALYTNGALLDITDLLDEYAPELKALFGKDLLNSTSIDGRIYGVPAYRQFNSDMYLVIRKDVLENAGVLDKAANMTSWTEFEECLAAIAESDQGCYGFGDASGQIVFHGFIASGGNFSDNITFDYLSDTLDVVYTDQNGNVSLLPEQAQFVEQCKMFQRWYSDGYIWSETPYTTSGDTNSNIANNVFASYVCASEYGVQASKTAAIGTDMLAVKLADSFISTAAGLKFGVAVPATSPEPEATVKFLNLLYTDDQLSTVFAWGVEGENYEVVDGMASYIGDADASTCGYHGNDWSFGNQFKVLPWSGQGADFRERALENMQNGSASRYLGFNFNTGDYATELAAVTSVVSEYHRQLSAGLYTDELYNEYLEKLDAADIDAWIGLYQSALTEWLG